MKVNLILLFLLVPAVVSSNNATCIDRNESEIIRSALPKDEQDSETCTKYGAAEIEVLIEQFESQEGLYQVSKDCINAKINVVFVHGIDGSAVQTFYAGEQTQVGYWPKHLSDSNPSYCIWTLQYTSRKWDLWKRGRTLSPMETSDWFAKKLSNKKIHEKPIVFVAHSLGGVIVKQMLQLSWYACDDWAPIWLQTRAVMFLATPHAGSSLVDIAMKIGWALKRKSLKERFLTPALQQMTDDNVPLRFLKDWYQKYAPVQDIKTIAFAEEKKLFGASIIVDKGSADPQVSGTTLSVVKDSDHLSISKPKETSSEVYDELSSFLQDLELRLDRGEVAGLEGQTVFSHETMSSLAKIRAWVKALEGYWWEKVDALNETLICFLRVKPDRLTNSLVLTGTTWNENGTYLADWKTLMARVELVDTEVETKYEWQEKPMGSSAKYCFGYGKICFKGPVGGKIIRGQGFFWNINQDRLAESDKRGTRVHRVLNATVIKTMREGSDEDQLRCARNTLANWKYYDGTQGCLSF